LNKKEHAHASKDIESCQHCVESHCARAAVKCRSKPIPKYRNHVYVFSRQDMSVESSCRLA
jgi:hypothetical protein